MGLRRRLGIRRVVCLVGLRALRALAAELFLWGVRRAASGALLWEGFLVRLEGRLLSDYNVADVYRRLLRLRVLVTCEGCLI